MDFKQLFFSISSFIFFIISIDMPSHEFHLFSLFSKKNMNKN